MAMTRGNRIAAPRKRRRDSFEKTAQYIAESIVSRIEEGREWDWHDYLPVPVDAEKKQIVIGKLEAMGIRGK